MAMGFEHSKCNSPVDCCLPSAGRRQHNYYHSIRNDNGNRFPSAPPTGHYVNTYFFYGGFALKIPFKSNAITENPPKS